MLHLHESVPELANPLQDLFLAVATTGLQSVGQFHYLQLEGRAEKRRSREEMGREQGERRVGRKENGTVEIEEGRKEGLGKGKEKKEH